MRRGSIDEGVLKDVMLEGGDVEDIPIFTRQTHSVNGVVLIYDVNLKDGRIPIFTPQAIERQLAGDLDESIFIEYPGGSAMTNPSADNKVDWTVIFGRDLGKMNQPMS